MSTLIDTDVTPYIPEGWSIVEHRQSGQMEWDLARISLYISETQNTGDIPGHDLRKELESKPVLNACVQDHLIDNPHLIPEEWGPVFFWGTIFRDSEGRLCVSFICKVGKMRDRNYRYLGDTFNDFLPAIISQD